MVENQKISVESHISVMTLRMVTSRALFSFLHHSLLIHALYGISRYIDLSSRFA